LPISVLLLLASLRHNSYFNNLLFLLSTQPFPCTTLSATAFSLLHLAGPSGPACLALASTSYLPHHSIPPLALQSLHHTLLPTLHIFHPPLRSYHTHFPPSSSSFFPSPSPCPHPSPLWWLHLNLPCPLLKLQHWEHLCKMTT
jgi:hypothetical protein